MRRPLLLLLLLALALPVLGACGRGHLHSDKRVVVIGIDGLDPDMVREGVAAGRLPNLKKLIERGALHDLQTSWPPQSPVAWSNFITGVNPGKHGLFDFIHADRTNYGVLNSMSRTDPEGMVLELFGYKIPLTGGATHLTRAFPAFWEVLDEAGVPVMVYRMPANFPMEPTGAETFPDMGTPDVSGASAGRAFLWTESLERSAKEGDFYSIIPVEANRTRPGLAYFRGQIEGPKNTALDLSDLEERLAAVEEAGNQAEAIRLHATIDQRMEVTTPFTAYVDTTGEEARLAIHVDVTDGWGMAGVGEWTPWVPVRFTMIDHVVDVSGWQRYLFKSADPLEIYGSPVQIDPFAPAMPVSTPDDAAAKLAEAIGPYYTQGFPDAYIAYKSHLLNTGEFVSQSDTVYEERMKMLHYAFDQFGERGGLLFFYLGSLDLRCHMLWHCMDPKHPHREADDPQYADQIQRIYRQADALVGEAMKRIQEWPGTELIVMSDHGFAPFYRRMNVNDWLVKEGYLVLREPGSTGSIIGDDFEHGLVDWDQSVAYSIGFNGVILNRKGREPRGIVTDEQAPALIQEIATKLRALKDTDGSPVFRRVLPASEVFSGPELPWAPDLQLGFSVDYGASDESATGNVTGEDVIVDNDSRWSGSHLMDPEVVRGSLITSKPYELSKDPALEDVTATLYALFGVDPPEGLDGKALFQPE